ncbi:MAG: ferrous iron transporter B [Gammaproteobacteria bacterium]|nr:ferrous iron transporter B [Gammaproteobacteria bacterium]
MNEALIIGSPNSGKSLLFNRLTGLQHKVANFPGITVDVSSGTSLRNPDLKLVDFPGVYSLHPISEEERIAVRALKKSLKTDRLEYVICLLDATRLEKGLYFALQLIQACQQHNKPVIVLANMFDILHRHSLNIDTGALSEALGVPVIAMSAKTGQGFEELHNEMSGSIASYHKNYTKKFLQASDSELVETAHRLAHEFGLKGDLLIKAQASLDAFFLHSFLGTASFFLIMYLLFQSIFTWAAPLMDLVDTGLSSIASFVLPTITSSIVHDFVKDALFGGFGAFLVFVPQIFVLTLVVGILEDSGYMARAAVICHKPLRFFGLTGKSFIPMLSGVACAIPGIYAARTIESPTKRWLTYLAVPLMPCSARLPVYALLIAAFIPAEKVWGGLFGLQGLAMFGIYFFGIFCGLLVTAFMSKARPDFHKDQPFVLEMPPYRFPSWHPLLRHSWNRSKHFVTKAGPTIFMVTVAVWVLGYFPNHGTDLSGSWLGGLGKLIQPLFEPLGLDWKYGVAILTSFLAREVFVGTLGTLFGIEGAVDDVMPLAEQIQNSGLMLSSGIALLVFFALALQCFSTLVILQKETGSWKLPVQMFFAYSVFAYLAAWISYQSIQFFMIS